MKLKLWYVYSFLVCCFGVQAQSSSYLDVLLNARQISNPSLYRKCADSLNAKEENDLAIRVFKKALTAPSLSKDKKEQALIYLSLGDCYDDKQEYRKGISYFNLSLLLVNELQDNDLLIRNFTSLAGAYSELEITDTALFFSEKVLNLAEADAKKYTNYLITIYNDLGLLYNRKWNYPLALSYFYKAIEVSEKTHDTDGLSSAYNNLGNLYSDLEDYTKGLEYYRKVLEIKPSSYAMANIGILYSDLENFDSSLYYIKKSIVLDKQKNDKAGLSSGYTVMGNLFKKVKQLDSAMYYYTLSTQLANEIEDVGVVLNNNYNIVELLMTKKEYQKAKLLAHENMNLLLQGNDLSFISDGYSQLKEIYFKLGDYKKAYEFHDKYDLYKDSARNADKSVEIKKIELNAEYKKKSSNDSLLHVQASLLTHLKHTEEIQKQQLILGGFILILIIVAVFSVLIFKRYKLSQQQKEIINLQKNEVSQQKLLLEEKQKEILDSIHYAKRIQSALIAHHDFLNEHLPQSFIYFNPKDIISGDFYWAAKQNGYFYLAVCDSTGHGVPGAFMSLLNIGYLSEAINEKDIRLPHEVLNHVRQRLICTISKDGQKDGFDGVLFCLDTEQHKITYAAANNRPVLIRNNTLMPLEFDRMPVGVSEKTESFQLYSIDVQKGDILYLYTDGYADQFGGPKGKKFKYKSLNELLIQNSHKTLTEQHKALQENFMKWKGDLEQVDDVCVIGVKF